MKKQTLFFLLIACSLTSAVWAVPPSLLTYEVNLNDRADDNFKVTLHVDGLKPENAVYQFAATAPGTYQVMDIGRFVRSFQAFDKKGKELKTEHVSTNQWKIEQPEQVREIRYQIAETWDTKVDKDVIYRMCGTSIEQDHVLINGQGVFGFPAGMQGAPLAVKLTYPDGWEVGTALDKNKSGYYLADNYDRIVDSPILLGRLTKAQTTVGGAAVELYTYSKSDQVTSKQLLDGMQAMLNAAGQFLKQLPVKRYAFLYHFEDESWGAWEHSYSSEYIFKEEPYSARLAARATNIAAHEFFHVVTPLNIHSELIQQFNFVTPTPSEHLWLYEGVTEWANGAMRLRGGLIDLPEYCQEMSQKVQVDKQLDTTYSLSKLALTCYTPEGQRQYVNIYNRGALVGALLDIRLLELSGGKRGLREVINEFATTYGPNRPFPEKEFFTIFAQKTYPEIADFFNRYVKDAQPLPLKEYFGKLGIRYEPVVSTGNKLPSLGMRLVAVSDTIRLKQLSEPLRQAGLQDNDELVSFNQQPVSPTTFASLRNQINNLKAGDTYEVTVRRNGQSVTVKPVMQEIDETKKYTFEPDAQATAQQLQLRGQWLKNL
ncbi:PDZ domain-containing protein [Spirosoma sp. BT702]|uniref:PDZ domain-containing protein n=1 Tax=Spirosoma profusum TaxID=2771354 RepID=A0A926XZ44_9BACT|nr:PDZ domain-containing protein [Spirosoma profusum]MBD2703654.1 PDZ domain-containing protein [Spirosoma profusum]